MQKIPISLAGAGMKVAKAVVNERGAVLCGPGTELTEALINRLSDMGVTRITVEGHPVDTGVPDKSIEQQVEELSERFRKVEGDPLMSKIRGMFLERLQEAAGDE